MVEPKASVPFISSVRLSSWAAGPFVLREEAGSGGLGAVCVGEDGVDQTGDVFAVLVPCERPRWGGKYESYSCMGDSDAVENIVSGCWCAPKARRGSQSGRIDDGTGSDWDVAPFALAVLLPEESWMKPGGMIDSGEGLAPNAPWACSRSSLELREAWRE